MIKGETILSGAPRFCNDCQTEAVMGIYRSNAGYYYGSYCKCGAYSRESDYYKTREDCKKALDKDEISWR